MRIAFVGKGGSGKTTLSSLFSRYLAATGAPVLAIDADVNQHMAKSLGFSPSEIEAHPKLGSRLDEIRGYVRGSNSRLQADGTLRATTPPGSGSRLIRDFENDDLLKSLALKREGIHFLAAGSFEEEDVGMMCFHGKTTATEILLNHIAEPSGAYVIADMTAGADAFSMGTFLKFDALVLVIEPTGKSRDVLLQFKELNGKQGIPLILVANKMQDKSDADFLRASIGEPDALIPFSHTVRAADRGEMQDLHMYDPELMIALKNIRERVDSVGKDWDMLHQRLVALHARHATEWLNASGHNYHDQIDPGFTGAAYQM